MLRIFKQYYPIRNIFFIIGEGVAICLSFTIANLVIFGPEYFELEQVLILKIVLITLLCQSCLYYADLYNIKVTKNIAELIIRLAQGLGVAAILMAVLNIALPSQMIGTSVFLLSVGIILVFVISWRLTYTYVLNSGIFDRKIFLIGAEELAHKIVQEIKEKPDCGYRITCVVLGRYHNEIIADACAPLIRKEDYKGLCDLATRMDIKTVVVAIKDKRGNFPADELLKCRVNGIEVIEGNSFYEMLTGKLVVEQINPSWLIFSEGFQKSWLKRLLKRLTDLLLSFILLIAFLPIIIITAILIKIDSKGPAFYSQERIGEKSKIYKIYKFRSMVNNAEDETGPAYTKKDDPRVTRIGRVIRKLRIDEIPQLWNVLKGDMSFVGPRPEREFFVNDYKGKIPFYVERFTVKPGITGWAQVCYRYSDSLEDTIEKLNYDLFYIKNMSFFMDLMIVLKTIKIVLFAKGSR